MTTAEESLIVEKEINLTGNLYVKGRLECAKIISKGSIRVNGPIKAEEIISGGDIFCITESNSIFGY